MKEVMQRHVSNSKTKMFRQPFASARIKITTRCNTGEKKFLLKINKLVGGMKPEYHQAVIGHGLSKISETARISVSKILAKQVQQLHEEFEGSSFDYGGAP